MKLKVTKKTKNKALHSLHTAYFFQYIPRAKAWIFFGWNFNVSFC